MPSLDEVIIDPRIESRIFSDLAAIIQVTEKNGHTWKELADISTVSRNGAGFTLSRPCVVGRLINIVLPLPPELRAYDVNEELYPVTDRIAAKVAG